MALNLIIALVMENKCVTFQNYSSNRIEVMTKVKVFNNDDADNNDDAGVMTINRRAKNTQYTMVFTSVAQVFIEDGNEYIEAHNSGNANYR